MKINEKTISEIKYCAKCAMCDMVNHKREYFPDDGSFDEIIKRMHAADNKDDLGKAYYDYIVNGINYGYSNGHIIGGIMQNEDKNKEFNINIDSIIEQFIRIKSGEEPTTVPKQQNINKTDTEQTPVPKQSNSGKPIILQKIMAKSNNATEGESEGKPTSVPKQPDSDKPNNVTEDKSTDNNRPNGKRIKKIVNKIYYINGLLSSILNNQSENPETDIDKIKSDCEGVKQKISSIDLTLCDEEEITKINNASITIDGILKSIDSVSKHVISAPVIQVQQPSVAHTQSPFNINNFIKQPAVDIVKNNPATSTTQKRKTAFPHQICGLTDEEITTEVYKHFRIIEALPLYPLYDLIKNKTLSNKMKELNSKQRANNPFLTQVNIKDYIDMPELLSQYSLCFTIPCNDKGNIIVVLFNPEPVQDKNGIWNYPIHIFKAKLNKKNNK